MVLLRLVWGVITLLTLPHQNLAISEDTKAALTEACDKDFLQPIPHVQGVRPFFLEECKGMIEKIPEDVNEAVDIWTGVPALQKAAAFGLVEVSKALIEAGADVNKVNRAWGLFDTALFIAARIGRPRICEVLINAGADINMKNNEGYGKTAIQVAMENNQNAVVDVLKKHGASVPQLGLPEILEFHGLATASEINGPSKNDLVLERTGGKDFPPLTFAAWSGNKEAISLLLDAGADVNYPSGMPLFEAVERGYLEATEMLLEAGADVNQGFGSTPLIKAVEQIYNKKRNERMKILKTLMEAGAELDATNYDGETAFYVAAKLERREIARMLVGAGADTSIMPSKSPSWYKQRVLSFLERLNQETNNQG